jgi:ABC-2 type transport system permease protein
MALAVRAKSRRIRAVMRKDLAELVRQPATMIPALLMVAGALIPAFAIAIIVPRLSGESLAESEFAEAARSAASIVPELQGLSGAALVQGFLFHQFLLLLLMVPIVGSMALAAHAVIGEKQARSLEPLLATPLETTELLAAKALTPLLVSLLLLGVALSLYLAGVAVMAAPGVWQSLVGPRTLLVVGLGGPLVSLAGLQSAVILSSRVNDARSAQQLGGLIVLPLTVAFVAQVIGQSLLGPAVLFAGIAALIVVNAGLLWLGVRVFDRETILMRWR